MTARKRSTKKTERVTTELDKLAEEAKKQYGGTVMIKGSKGIPFTHMPTGVFQLDLASLGGFPEGHTGLIYGMEGACKTTTAIKVIIEAQKKYPDLTPVYLDAETHYDKQWFEQNGVDIDNIRVIQNIGVGEAYADMLTAVAETGEVSLIILDSIPALIPRALLEASAEDNYKVAARAEIVNRIYSRLITARQTMIRNGKHPVTAILINQLKQKIGGYAPNGIIPTFLPGGTAQLYLSYLSVRLRKPKDIEATDPETGLKTIVESQYGFKLDKPKAGCAFKQGDFTLVKSNTHKRCKVSGLDDVALVVKYAKSIGMIGGGGKKQTFMMFPDEVFAPKNGVKALSYMASRLFEDKYKYSLTKAVIIAIVRMRHEKSPVPYDNYLCGHTLEEISPYIDQILSNKTKKEGVQNGTSKKKAG